MPLIRDYIDEHAYVLNVGGEAVRAIDRGDLPTARELLASMAVELKSHFKGEEDGIFTVMLADELFAEHITPLIREHRELEELLATVDVAGADGQRAIRDAVEHLFEHTRKEEDGIFPAALTSLDGDQWDAAIEAWQDAHPGREMLRRGV